MEALLDRIKSILLTPKEAWETIKAEETSSTKIVREYLIYLAAIPAIAHFIGYAIVGRGYPAPADNLFWSLIQSAVWYVLMICGIFIGSIIINALTPNFNASKNDFAAFKLVAYSMTPAFLAGVFYIIPNLVPLTIVGFYGLYLLYVGIPVLLDCPQEKTVSFTIVSGIVLFVLYLVMLGIADRMFTP